VGETIFLLVIQGGGYKPWVRKLESGDYVYLQQIMLTMLDVTVRHVILCM
jgi:hypothetical protein